MAHIGEEGFLLPSALHRLAQRLCHLFDLLLVVHLLRGIHEGDDQPPQHAGLSGFFGLRPGEHGRGAFPFRRLLPLIHLIGGDAEQVGLAGDGSAVPFNGRDILQHIPAEADEVNGREIECDIPEGTSHILLCHMEFRGDVFREFPDVQVPVHHQDAHQRGGKEVCHVIVQSGQLRHLGLVLGVHGVELLVHGLQLFVGALQLLIRRQQFFIRRLQLRVHALQLGDGLLQAVLGKLQIMLQVRDSLRRRRVHLVLADIPLQLPVAAEEGDRRIAAVVAVLVEDRLGHQRHVLRLFPDLHRNIVKHHLVPQLPAFPERSGDGDPKICAEQGENVQGRRSLRNTQERPAFPVGPPELVLLIHQDRHGHQRLEDAGLQLSGPVRDLMGIVLRTALDLGQRVLEVLHRVGDLVVGRRLSAGVVDEDPLVGIQDAEHIVIVEHRLGAAQEQETPVIQRHVEDREEIPLQHGLEIDQKVSAADQVQLSERRILENIVLGKDDHLADVVPDLVLVSLPVEITAQPHHADILDNVVAVDAPGRRGDCVGIQVRREDLDIPAAVHLLHDLRKEDRDGVSFLTGRAASHPDTDLTGARRLRHQRPDNALLQDLEVFRVAEEAGDADQDLLREDLRFLRVRRKIIHIFPEIPVVGDHQTAFYAPEDRGLLVIGIVDVGDRLQDAEHLRQEVTVRQLQPAGSVRH